MTTPTHDLARPLLRRLARGLAGCTDAQADRMLACMRPRTVARGALLMPREAVWHDVAFIARGCFRLSFLERDGAEHTAQIMTEGTFVADYESVLTGQPSTRAAEALEDSEVLLLARADQQALYDADPAFERFGRRLAEHLYLVSARRYASFLRLDAAERYDALATSRPNLLQRVPQYVLASYLGITPETFSRIRARRARRRS